MAHGERGPVADAAYQHDPIGWMRDVLAVPEHRLRWSLNPGYRGHQWDGTPDPLAAVCEGLAAGNDVGVESGTNVGKTYLAGALSLWFLACFEDALVVTVAPKQDQLTAQLWKEIGGHWDRFTRRYPSAETVQLRVRMRPGTATTERWAIIGYAVGVDAGSESAVRAQGFHARHMLVVHEETPGIDPSIMVALANTCTGSHNLRLALGNPDYQLDPLHLFCAEPGVIAVRVSALDHPNIVCRGDIVPGAVSPKGIARLAGTWGEGSPMYDSRVRGISPAQASNALIRHEWLVAAAARWREAADAVGARALGIDVAQSPNGDKGAIADWQGARLLEVSTFPCPNATELGRDVAGRMRRDNVLPQYVGVDPVGVGAATLNHLREQPDGYAVQSLNGGVSPWGQAGRAADGSPYDWVPDENSFLNLRSQNVLATPGGLPPRRYRRTRG